MEEFPVVTRRGSGLSTEQKVASVLLLFLGLGGVVLGFKSFGANIRRPFEAQLARSADASYLTPTEREAKELEASKSRDTDHDGLNDYDEQEVFKTSAFLADTDSDGFDDKTEVFSGNDPNCPADKDCGRATADATVSEQGNPDALLGSAGEGLFSSGVLPNIAIESEEDLMKFFDGLTPDEIREALAGAGVPPETLAQVDDETLRAMFNDAIDQASASGDLADVLNTLKQGNAPVEEEPVIP